MRNLLKKPLKTVLAGAAAAAVAAGIWAATVHPWAADQALNANPAAVGPAEIPALTPASSDTFVIAPATEDWWRKVAAMAYADTKLVGLDPVKAGITLDRIGYSQSPDVKDRGLGPTGPLRLFYAEAPTEQDAQKAADWLRQAPGWDSRKVFVQGRVVIVAANWVDSYQAPAKAITTVPGYATDNDPAASTYWLNVDQQTTDLLGAHPAQAKADAAQAIIRQGLGFKQGTTWLGTGTNGSSWSGRFASGGVDPSQVDTSAVDAAVRKTHTVYGEATDRNVHFSVYDAGTGQALAAANIRVGGKTLGAAPAQSFPSVQDEQLNASMDVGQWDSGLSGFTGTAENIGERFFSANDTQMILSQNYNARTMGSGQSG